jgi:RNA polymerase sigma-70 factor (ECF subfamily)
MTTFRTRSANKHSDEALVAATKRGDAQAFEDLVLRHRPRVLAVVQRITKNREDAEDVAQESFHKAFRHLDAFQEKSRFSTWLTRIAMNEAFMLLRRRRGVVEVLPQNSDESLKPIAEAFVDLSPNPEESYMRQERTELLTEAISLLGSNIRTTILLRDIQEKSVEETAQILGTSISAVKARLFHGRRKLRRTINAGLFPGVYGYGRAEAQRQ